ncbi:MAG: Gfo/Idh/MocA family oxidoreductase [Lentisphaeria bacterium]|nr:Gfo/Idh/MocA family oxidoreductase [Lentisphaeria bacterium]
MNEVKIAIVGAGMFADWVHYPSLMEIDDCRIVAICDLLEDRLHHIGDKYNITDRFTCLQTMIDTAAPDAVYIIMSPDALEEPVTRCLEQGLSVFVEKPPGLSSSQLRRWQELAAQNGGKTMVGFNRRFAPLIREARRIVEAEGPITLAVAQYFKNFAAAAECPYNPEIAHSILLYDTIHSVDLLRWLGGEVSTVQSAVDRVIHDYQNSFHALIEFSRAQGVLLCNFAAGGRVERFEIHGHGISVFIEPPGTARVVAGDEERGIIRTSELTGVAESAVQACKLKGDGVTHRIYGYLQESQHFIDCLRHDRTPDTDFADALKTVTLVEEIAGV